MRSTSAILVILLLFSFTFREEIPILKDFFAPPVTRADALVGTFGELRPATSTPGSISKEALGMPCSPLREDMSPASRLLRMVTAKPFAFLTLMGIPLFMLTSATSARSWSAMCAATNMLLNRMRWTFAPNPGSFAFEKSHHRGHGS